MSQSSVRIKINPFLILIALLFFAAGKLEIFLCFYFCAVCHELFHFAACVFLKEDALCFAFYPYGVNMQTKFIKNPVSHMIISACGPLFNITAYILCKDKTSLFSTANLFIFLLNSLPALPLDGGVFLRELVSLFKGYVISQKIMIEITKIIGALIFFAGIILAVFTKYNISLLIIGVFLLYNIKNEKMQIISLRKKIICSETSWQSTFFKIKSIGVCESFPVLKCIDFCTYKKELVISVFSSDSRLLGSLSQGEITKIILYGKDIKTCGEAVCKRGFLNELQEENR